MINSAICGVGLIVQIEQLKEEGRPVWDAVVEATEHRMRPIMLTAAVASLALIPIACEIFWGTMAYAMMGGIIVGTMLTLLFLPALYVASFRIKEPASVGTGADAASMSAEEPSRLAQPVAQPAH
jgi:Cu/Ag efflux pump CusA